jgi:glycosyltransferase involved in cell wall biosynthesis
MRVAMNYDIRFTASIKNYRRLCKTLDDFAPDIVHLHGQFFDLSWMSTTWARRKGVPLVLTVHTALVHIRPVYSAILWLADMMVARPFIMLGRPDVVVFDKWITSYVKRRYRIPENRLHPILIGVDPTRFEAVDPQRVREQSGIGDRPLVLSLGHVIPVRNRVTLLRALPELRRRYPDVAVVIVGDVHDDAFLKEARRLGVDSSLVITGAVSKDEIPYFVAAADVETHDHQGYGLGTTTLEVMAAGKPAIVAAEPDNFPGLRLVNWENSILIDREDHTALARALIRVLDDPALGARIGAAQRTMILENFTMPKVASRHLALFESLCADAHTGHEIGEHGSSAV